VNRRLKRLKVRCNYFGENHHTDYCEKSCIEEEDHGMINIDYNFQLKKILDKFLGQIKVHLMDWC
jgi:hypothetical protein